MDNRRRQILADMGIEVWVIRSAVTADAISVPMKEPSAPIKPSAILSSTHFPVNSPLAPDSTGNAPAVTLDESAASPKAPASTLDESAATKVSGESPPVSLITWSFPGVMLLSATDLDPGQRRLVLDLLGAASGRFDRQPATAGFNWSELAASSMALDAGRALQAFLARRIEAVEARLMLVDAPLITPLQPLLSQYSGIRIIELPTLDELAWSAQLKQALWRRLQNWAD